MRAVKAKLLRRKLGFHPAAPRDYDTGPAKQKIVMGANGTPQMTPEGKPQLYVVTGSIKTAGARRSYQAVKRNPVLTAALLGAQ